MGVEFKRVKVADLHEDPANVRKHGPQNRATVRASLKEFGQVEALVVERGTGRVIGGNCRLVELREMGEEDVWVAEADVHGVDATRLGIVLNRSAEIAEWDDDALASILRDLDAEGVPLDGLGWTDKEIADMLDEDPGDDGGCSDDIDPMQGTYAVLITCTSEAHQRQVLEQLSEEGLECRAWNL